MMEKRFYVYILASKRNGTLYLGVTSDIVKRVWQHKNGLAEGFTKNMELKDLFITKSIKMPRMLLKGKNSSKNGEGHGN